MDKQIFIINGSGGVGKDTFVKIIENYWDICTVCNYSSVSKVKKIAQAIGWNGSKTERDRKFLSDLKLLTTAYNDMPLNDMKEVTENFMYGENKLPRMMFLHIREPEEIAKAVDFFKEYNVKTILVKRDSVKHITSNMADENVYNYNYDITINNHGTIEDLEKLAKNFLTDFLNNSLKNEY